MNVRKLIIITMAAVASIALADAMAESKAPTYADVAYDVHERTKLDFWQAEGDGPRPLYVFIHGGGWVGGNKRRPKDADRWLDKGVSIAAINYRLSGADPLPVPVHDAVRAIQFLRYKAEAWNIDKERFVLTGGSAGGCSSLLIACHDDFADPGSADPVERESSRVQGVAVAGAQTAIDPKLIEPWIGTNVYHQMIYKAVGETSIETALANYEKHASTYSEFSAYNHLTKDDPPLCLRYGGDMTLPAKTIGRGIHHGMFGVKLKERSAEVGHNQVHLFIKGTDVTTAYADPNDFIARILLDEKEGALKRNDRIVFLGDSITAAGARPGGYVALSSDAISKAYPEYGIEVIGAGIGGHKVPDCQKRLDRDVLQKNPTIVLIYIGINDVWHWTHPRVKARGKKGTTPEAFESGLKDMIKQVNDVGARVILCTPTVIGEKADGSNPDDKMLDQYSDISRKVAKQTGSQLLDLRKAFIAYLKEHNPENAEKGILTGDSVHMNARGNRLLSTLVLEALNVPGS